MSRKDQIISMLEEAPQDTFLRYALAMEFKSEGDSDQSLKLFNELMEEDPPHVSAFFMAGQQLAAIDQISEAKEVLERGIVNARQQGDSHAAGEMTEFLQSLI